MCGVTPESYQSKVPDEHGRFGDYGGQYMPEMLMVAVHRLEEAYGQVRDDPAFWAELDRHYRQYAGRPSPLYFATRLTEHLGGARVYL